MKFCNCLCWSRSSLVEQKVFRLKVSVKPINYTLRALSIPFILVVGISMFVSLLLAYVCTWTMIRLLSIWSVKGRQISISKAFKEAKPFAKQKPILDELETLREMLGDARPTSPNAKWDSKHYNYSRKWENPPQN